jgi:hypothetical protein
MRLRFFFRSLIPVFFLAAIGFFSSASSHEKGLIASYSYQGPTQRVPGNPQLVRVEVLMRDSPEAGGVRIKSVDFNGQGIPLQMPDIYGNRGTGSFQVPPGKYKLRWVVQRDKLIWPRVLTHEEEVTIAPRDLWLQIEIVGETASIR